MKALRNLIMLLSMFIVLMLQGCGDDTGGALTMVLDSSLIVDSNYYEVTAEISYTPPSGKSAQGVVVTYVATYLDDNGVSTTETGSKTLTSNSDSFVLSQPVIQFSDKINTVSIVASIGSMTTSAFTIIPKIPVVVPAP